MIMKKVIPVEIMDAESMVVTDMGKNIPAVAVVVTRSHWKEKMQEKHAKYIIRELLTTVLSLILPMTVENHWNSSVVQA